VAAEKESFQRQMSMSRGSSRWVGERGQFDQQVCPDGWAVGGGGGPPRPPSKAGDLSQFSKIKAMPMTFGPSSVFAGKKDLKGRIGQSGVTEAPQRKKLQLLRRKPTEEEAAPASADPSEEDEAEEAGMSEADAKKKIDEDSKEFFSVRNLEEAEVYFTNLTPEHRFRLVDNLVTSAIESKEADAQLVGDLFSHAVSKDLCSMATLEEGFLPTAEILDDVAIDAPKAFNLMAIMMKGAGLDKDDERKARIAAKSIDGDKLVALVS
jgi:translation initiation factor 4G